MSKKKAEMTDAGTSVSVRLSKELLEWLDTRAEKENRSRANLIETLLKRCQESDTK